MLSTLRRKAAQEFFDLSEKNTKGKQKGSLVTKEKQENLNKTTQK